jgi:Domain of unknown function (DUF5666)
MHPTKSSAPLALLLTTSLLALIPIAGALSNRASTAALEQSPTAQNAASRPVGTVKAISGNSITLTTDAGTDITVNVQDSTRIVRTAPGQKDLTGASAIQLKDVQVGDRILVRGTPSGDSKSIAAAGIIVMKKSDIEQKQAQQRADWQKRGVGGLVTAVDQAAGTITISSASLAGSKNVVIHTSKGTIIRRYAPDSVKFDDAKLGTLDQIQPGDQLRARGDRSPDGGELNAEEIVSGSFRNIAGTVQSTDAPGNTLTVTDLKTKKPVTVKLTPDSQFRKLPPMMAQIMAARMSGAAGAAAGSNSSSAGGNAPAAGSAQGARQGAGSSGGRAGGGDFQQMLNRLPNAQLADLQKGDALMIVATQGTGDGPVTAITMLSGVEPILAASPKGSQPMILTPWNLEASGGEAAASQ